MTKKEEYSLERNIYRILLAARELEALADTKYSEFWPDDGYETIRNSADRLQSLMNTILAAKGQRSLELSYTDKSGKTWEPIL
jgi:hypothetical protein